MIFAIFLVEMECGLMILGFDCCVPVQICEFFFFFELIVCLGDLIGRPDVYT